MSIVVKFFATFRDLIGYNQVELPIQAPIPLQQVLDQLFTMYGEKLQNNMLENGKIRHMVKILVNGRDIRWLANLDTPVQEGDTIAIFPPIGGGNSRCIKAWNRS